MQWVVVDDGHPRMDFSFDAHLARGIDVTRIYPLPSWVPGQNTLARNLVAGLREARHEWIFFIEDDEWYAPDYVEIQLRHLQQWQEGILMLGERPAVYYNVEKQLYAVLKNNIHASLCQTVIHRSLGPLLERVCQAGSDSIDIRLWQQVRAEQKGLHEGQRSLGIKGMPGRPGLGTGHRPALSGIRWAYDGTWRYLESVIGEDYLHYKAISTKEMEGEFEIFFWQGQKRYRCNQKWANGTPCSYDTFDYQTLLDHIKEPHGRSRKTKAAPVASFILGPDGEPLVHDTPEVPGVEFKDED
jgi:hypothetical protein